MLKWQRKLKILFPHQTQHKKLTNLSRCFQIPMTHHLVNNKRFFRLLILVSAVAIPETLTSSTPIIPEVVTKASDLDSFKAEMKSLVERLENDLTLVKNGEWLPNCENFQNLRTNASLLDKVVIPLKSTSNLKFRRLKKLKNESTNRW